MKITLVPEFAVGKNPSQGQDVSKFNRMIHIMPATATVETARSHRLSRMTRDLNGEDMRGHWRKPENSPCPNIDHPIGHLARLPYTSRQDIYIYIDIGLHI